MNPLQGKRIVLGVSGSIAAYKAADLASKLTQAGALVDVVLSEEALRFVTPLTFASLTGRKVYSSLWEEDAHVIHVGLGESADLLLIAPCTANTLAKLAAGQADNLLTLTALAARCPVLVAPAMDGGMFEHPATQANLETLRRRGVQVLGPAPGRMASGLRGLGRMLEPGELLGQVRLALSRGGPLAGRHVVVSAGGTQEPLDPVRYLTNRSSGKQGFALAQAALDLGARVSLVVGATAALLPTPAGAERTDVETAAQMAEAVLELSQQADVLIMAAAVADFRPREVRAHKIKKGALPRVELEPTPDILLAVAEQRRRLGRPVVVVGFAAESERLLENAQDKLERKGLSMIVANDISAPDAGFAVDTNRVFLLFPGGGDDPLRDRPSAVHPGDDPLRDSASTVHPGDDPLSGQRPGGPVHPGDDPLRDRLASVHPGDDPLSGRRAVVHQGDDPLRDGTRSVHPVIEPLPLMTKSEVAQAVLARVVALLAQA